MESRGLAVNEILCIIKAMFKLTTNNAALKSIQNALEQLDPKNQRFAVAVAMTKTAKIAQADLKSKISTTFDRPNPYTMNSTFVQTASKNNLKAAVKFKDSVTKGRASGKNQPNKYLNPQVYSGTRQLKGIERKLASIAPEMAGSIIVPTRNTPLDSYGNPAPGIYNKVIAGLVGKGKTPKGRNAKTVYVVQKTGILQINRDVKTTGRGKNRSVKLTNTGVKRIFSIAKKASYKKRLDFYDIIRKSVDINFRDQLIAAIKLARETAR